jgi:hypothetical protein
MSGHDHAGAARGGAEEPTRHAPTDFMSRHEGAEGHGDDHERRAHEISRELNERSEFVQGLLRHAEEHRNRLPAPDAATPP